MWHCPHWCLSISLDPHLAEDIISKLPWSQVNVTNSDRRGHSLDKACWLKFLQQTFGETAATDKKDPVVCKPRMIRAVQSVLVYIARLGPG